MRHGSFGVSAESQQFIAEERRQARKVLKPGAEELAALPPDSIEDLNQDDGSGNNRMSFIFGLHNPFDSKTDRWFHPGG